MISLPLSEPLFHGHAELEPTDGGIRIHRLPAGLRRQFPDPPLMGAEDQPAGVRLVLETTASALELELHTTRGAFPGAERARGVVDVVVDGEVLLQDELTGGDTAISDPASGTSTHHPGPAHTTRVPLVPLPTGPGPSGLPGTRRVEFWLPYSERVLLRDLRAEEPAGGAGPLARPVQETCRRWLHYGSSISHGSNAATPLGTWTVRAARSAGVRLRNLGFSGSALVDPFMARLMRDTPADLLSLKVGINVVGGDVMRRRTFSAAVHGFLDTIRDGHPQTPLLLISPLHCGIYEDRPGPGAVDPEDLARGRIRFTATGDPADVAGGRLSLRTARETLAEVLSTREDPHLHFLDGLDLFGEQDEHELPHPDDLHPGPAAHARIADRFVQRAFGNGGAFAQG